MKKKEKEEVVTKYINKNFYMFLQANEWLRLRQEGKTLIPFFEKNNYRNIAIYGLGDLGKRLVDELSLSDIKVIYCVDRKNDIIYKGLPVYSMNEKLPDVDAIIVTSDFYFDEIFEELSTKVDCDIVNLDDIIFEI